MSAFFDRIREQAAAKTAAVSSRSWFPEYVEIFNATQGDPDALIAFANRAPTQYADFDGVVSGDYLGTTVAAQQSIRATRHLFGFIPMSPAAYHQLGDAAATVAKVGLVAGFAYAGAVGVTALATEGTAVAVGESATLAGGGEGAVGATDFGATTAASSTAGYAMPAAIPQTMPAAVPLTSAQLTEYGLVETSPGVFDAVNAPAPLTSAWPNLTNAKDAAQLVNAARAAKAVFTNPKTGDTIALPKGSTPPVGFFPTGKTVTPAASNVVAPEVWSTASWLGGVLALVGIVLYIRSN